MYCVKVTYMKMAIEMMLLNDSLDDTPIPYDYALVLPFKKAMKNFFHLILFFLHIKDNNTL